MQMLEAFRALNALNEDTFSLDAEGIQGLSNFKQNDDFEDDISIIDPEAESEEDLQDNYIGKVILDCCVCHSKLYKDKEEINIDENGELANVGEECPYCFTPDGFKVVGEVVAFSNSEEEPTDVNPVEDTEAAEEVENDEADDEVVEESLNEDINKATTAEEVEEGLLGDINLSLDASGQSVGLLGGTGGSVTNEDVEEPIEEGIFGFKTKKEKAAEAKAKAEREAKRQAERERAEEDERNRQSFAADSWARHDKAQRDAKAEYNRNRYNSIKGDKPSNTGYRGVNYSGGDYYESLEESIEDLSMTANDTHIEVSEEENGKVTVSMEPATNEAGGEMIAPVSLETEAEIMGQEENPVEEPVEEIPSENEEIDVDFDEFDEESMDELGESYLKNVYENVESFKTEKVSSRDNNLIIEGIVNFTSGNSGKTSFIFESKDMTSSGVLRFKGENKQLTEGKKAFILTGRVNDNKLVLESLSYNYKQASEEGKTSRAYGVVRTSKKV